MTNWKELQRGLLILIAQRLRLMEDYVAFGAVCKSWRGAATKENFKGIAMWQKIPSLMLAAAYHDDYRELYGLPEDKVVGKIFLPETKGKRCMEAGFGWLFTIGQDGDASLLNAFTRDQICLPNGKANEETQCPYIQKAVLSSSPCENPSEFLLVVIYRGNLLSWRPGDELWTRSSTYYRLHDVAVHKGHFYVISCIGKVFGMAKKEFDERPNQNITFVCEVPPDFPSGEMYYIVGGSADTLQIVARNGVQFVPNQEHIKEHLVYDSNADEDSSERVITYWTNEFRVLEFDLVHKKWTEILDLGDRAIFVGHSVSIAIDQTSKFQGIKANHIYFTDDYRESYTSNGGGGGRDMGVYSLKECSITKHYKSEYLSYTGPSIWIMPCESCMSIHSVA